MLKLSLRPLRCVHAITATMFSIVRQTVKINILSIHSEQPHPLYLADSSLHPLSSAVPYFQLIQTTAPAATAAQTLPDPYTSAQPPETIWASLSCKILI